MHTQHVHDRFLAKNIKDGINAPPEAYDLATAIIDLGYTIKHEVKSNAQAVFRLHHAYLLAQLTALATEQLPSIGTVRTVQTDLWQA
jgi:hypothetical protein